jgi:hypothetical protein
MAPMARQDTITAGEEVWGRVAEVVRQRRSALNLTHTQATMAAGGGVSMNVWSLLENNKQTKYRRRTLVAVARALQWPDDAVLRVVEGLDPVDENARPTQTAVREARPSEVTGETVTLPAGLARRLREATPDEMARLEAYLDGLFDRRSSH